MKQKFVRGDKVRVKDDLGFTHSHFRSGFDAIILGSYADQFGGDNTNSYTILSCDTGTSISWYYDEHLEFVEHVGEQEITRIDEEAKKRIKQESDIEWIWDNWPEIRRSLPSMSAVALMNHIGIRDPWGQRGEGVTFYANAKFAVELLDPILTARDREAFDKMKA